VLQTVVAEVHGPDSNTRRRFAADMTDMFERAPNLGDVDNYMEEPWFYWRFEVDTEKAVRRGISVDTINRNLSMAMGNFQVGDIKVGRTLEPTNIVIQVPLALRSQINRLGDLPIPNMTGATVPLAELGRFVRVPEDFTVFHKDLRPVEYVTAESVGRLGAPIYGMLQIEEMLKGYTAPDGQQVTGHYIGPPADDTRSGFEWGGEWTVTYETFRDLGIAFAAALVLIYILVVWEFGNFRVPALIMAPIPLTLLGIVPGHWLLGAEFTATSMIGWIALAGIIVRNSILLVDFSIHAIRRGMSVQESVIQSCKTRTRPIMITALALVAGSSVILTDPIFKGMAISLAFGVMVSTILTLVVIPLGCISASDSLTQLAGVGSAGSTGTPPPRPMPAPQPARSTTGLAARLREGMLGGVSALRAWASGIARQGRAAIRRHAGASSSGEAVRKGPSTPELDSGGTQARVRARPPSQPAMRERSGARAAPGPTPSEAAEPASARQTAEHPQYDRQAVVAGPRPVGTPRFAEPPATPVREVRPGGSEEAPAPASVTDISSAQASLRRAGGSARKRRGIRLKADVADPDEQSGTDQS
jgi:hypothetical protein